MNFLNNPYLPPIAASIAALLAVVALITAVTFLIIFKKKISVLGEELALSHLDTTKLDELQREFKELQARFSEVEQQRAAPVAEWFSDPASVNLNRRGQVLRLYRRGESANEIASSLGVSQGEVKLIIRMHEISRTGSNTEKSDGGALIGQKFLDTDRRGRQ
jgi:ATP/maltotriose-dependent transcriptional regulator MalT